jgi:hypothetical protein
MAKKIKLSLSNDTLIWDSNRRYKLNTVVEYNGVAYQNITGLNSQPNLLIDWQKSFDGDFVNKSGIENSLPILDVSGNNLGAIETNDDHVSIKGSTGVLLDAPSAVVNSLAGYTDYLVGVGLDGQLIPVKRDSGLYAPTATNSTVQNLVANTPTKMLAIITTTQSMTSPTLQWSINFTNTSNQATTVRIKLGLNNVATGTGILYTVPRFTSLTITGASPYAPIIASGTEISAFIESSTVAVVNSVTIKLDSGVSALQLKTVGGQSLFGTGNVTEVQNSLSASSILAPSVDAVNGALSGKQNTISGTANYLTKFGAGGVVPSQVFDNGSTVTVNSPLIASSLRVNDQAPVSFAGGVNDLDSMIYGSGANKWLTVWTNQAERLRVTSAGNLLVGTTTDNLTDKLQVNGSAIATAWKVTGGLVTQYQTGTGTVVDFETSVRGSLLTGYTAGSNTALAATDTLLAAMGKIQGQITAKENTITAGTTLQYYRGDKTWQTLNSAAVPELTNLYYTNARAIAAPITGYVSGAGTVAATDTILQAINKLNGNNGLKANLASPALTGVPTAPTATLGDNTTQIATTAFVTGAVSAVATSGTYTPTFTAIQNVSSVTANGLASWIKVGNIISVTIPINITPTAATTTTIFTATIPQTRATASSISVGSGTLTSSSGFALYPTRVLSTATTTVSATYIPSNISVGTGVITFQYDLTQ